MLHQTDEFCLLVLRHLPRVRRVIRRLEHPSEQCLFALADALQLQADTGVATPETTYVVCAALSVLAGTLGIDRDASGITHALYPLMILAELNSPPCNCKACRREACQR